ncbi:MAG: TetR/AcrR family transcriptional regulator [Lachnospiraceae bacterium]|nr:TetR/AcrR family transcriptional regulator [Lachnospiraceae bacterium]
MAESKSSKIRRTEILNAAEELFSTKGYEKTTTVDIMQKVGIAKGTLYYHFTSKEEILDALIERMGRRMIAKALICAGQQDEPVFERMLQVLMSLNASKHGSKDLVEIMHQPRNELLHEKSRALIVREAGPILTGLVQEGIGQGLCKCKYPAQTVEMVLLYVLLAFDDMSDAEAEPEKMLLRIDAFINNLEKLFGTAPGTFEFVRKLLAENH